MGNLYSTIGKYKKALKYFEKANELYPQNSNLLFNIALNSFKNLKYEDAIKNGLLSIKVNPHNFQSYNLLGTSYQNKGMIEEAVYCYRMAIKINPKDSNSFFQYGVLCLYNNRVSDSLLLFQKAKELGCNYPELNYYISTSKFNNFDGIKDNLKEFLKVFENNLDNPQFLSSYYLPMLYNENFSNQELFELHKKFDPSKVNLKVNKNNNKKLRIGYVSADFTNHSVGYFIDPVLENHNSEKFDIYLYFNSNKPDDKTKKFISYDHNWRDIFDKSDEYVYQLIKKDKIDVL